MQAGLAMVWQIGLELLEFGQLLRPGRGSSHGYRRAKKGCESKGVVLLSVKGAVPLARRLVDHVNIHIPCACLHIAYIGIGAEGCTLWNLARAKLKRLLQCTKPKAFMECRFGHTMM